MKKSNVIINDSIPYHFEDIQKIFHDAYGKNINEFTFINNNEIKEINETNKKKKKKKLKTFLIKIKKDMMKKKKKKNN